METTKWFDTNYHYIVPELGPDSAFHLNGTKPFVMLEAAKTAGINGKPVLIGPVTFLSLAKSTVDGFDPLTLLDRVLPVYAEIITRLAEGGAEWIQLDEPILVTDVSPSQVDALSTAYTALSAAKGSAKLLVQTMFDSVETVWDTLINLPVDGVGLDFVRGPQQVTRIVETGFPEDKVLVAGVIDGRNIWAARVEGVARPYLRLDIVLAPARPVRCRTGDRPRS
jgi:5-methyltetrahydropteroyltriglutamate--homocysteine methyltransferase